MNPIDWIVSGDTGRSSETIWSVMVGAKINKEHWYRFDIPYDKSDFGRCYRLLKLFPEWKTRLHEVSKMFPKWGPMVREWNKLEEMYENNEPMDEILEDLRYEGMRDDGWILKSNGNWYKDRP